MTKEEALQKAIILIANALHPCNAQYLPEYRLEIIRLVKIGTKEEAK